MPTLELTFASGESTLSVRRFSVHEAISSLFTVSVVARSPSADVDLEALVGRPASLRVESGYRFAELGGGRLWTGLVCVRRIVPSSAGRGGSEPGSAT